MAVTVLVIHGKGVQLMGQADAWDQVSIRGGGFGGAARSRPLSPRASRGIDPLMRRASAATGRARIAMGVAHFMAALEGAEGGDFGSLSF